MKYERKVRRVEITTRAHSPYFTSSWSSYRLYHEATIRTVAYVSAVGGGHAGAHTCVPSGFGLRRMFPSKQASSVHFVTLPATDLSSVAALAA